MPKPKTTTEKRIETMARIVAKAVCKLDKSDRAAAAALSTAGEQLVAQIRAGAL